MLRSAACERNPRASRTFAAAIPVSLGLAIAALLLFSWLADDVIRNGTNQFDTSVRSLIHHAASPALTSVMRSVTNLGDWQVILTSTVCLILILGYRRDWDYVRLLLITMAGAGILDGVLKQLFHRARPDPFFAAQPTSYAFPSGHALISVCFYGLLAGILSFELRKLWQRVVVWCLAAAIIGLVGLSRIYLGVHWPSDVLAGYAAALIWMGAVRQLALRMGARARDGDVADHDREVSKPKRK